MSRPILLALLSGLFALLGRPIAAPACSCVRSSAARYLEQAELVFLGRAEQKTIRGDLSVQPFTVLHLIKGRAAPVFERALKEGAVPPCHIEYPKGAIAVIFSTKGTVDPCAGNYELEAQLTDLGTYLAYPKDALPVKSAAPPEAAAFAAAFGATLAPYLHDRPIVQVGFAPLAGTTITVGKTRLSFVPKASSKKHVQITRALVAGNVRLVSGSYGAEGYSFDVLLLKRDAQPGDNPPSPFEVLKAFGRER